MGSTGNARRIATLEERLVRSLRRGVTFSDAQWARVSDEDLDFLASLPANHDQSWALERWTAADRTRIEAICSTATGEPFSIDWTGFPMAADISSATDRI